MSHTGYHVAMYTKHITRARDSHSLLLRDVLRSYRCAEVSVLSTYRGHRYMVCARYLRAELTRRYRCNLFVPKQPGWLD